LDVSGEYAGVFEECGSEVGVVVWEGAAEFADVVGAERGGGEIGGGFGEIDVCAAGVVE